MPKNAKQLVVEMQAIWDEADREGRDLTMCERTDMQERLDAIRAQKNIEDIGRSLGAGMEFMFGDGSGAGWGGGSPGERFTASQGYRKIKSASSRPQSWSSGPVDVGFYDTKGTLLEGSGSPGSGSGGGLIPTPQVVGGVVAKLFQPLKFEGLLLSGVATGNSIRYGVEGTATSAAAGVAEAGLKPESTLGYGVADEPVKKVATSLTISDELLEDAPAIQQFVNSRLTLFVNIEVERQLFRGTQGGNEVQAS